VLSALDILHVLGGLVAGVQELRLREELLLDEAG
jgi:hypothetical protein